MLIFINFEAKKVPFQLDNANRQLQWILQDIVTRCGFSLPYSVENYVLRLPGENGDYISEQNIQMLTEGSEVTLQLSPSIEAKEAVSNLRSQDEIKKKKVIFSLSKQFQDHLFAAEFCKHQGTEVILGLIDKSTGNTLAYALSSLQTLMEHNEDWKVLMRQEFVGKIIGYFNNTTLNICRPSTAILIKMVTAGWFAQVFKAFNDAAYQTAVSRLGENDVDTQLNNVNLITNLLTHAGPYIGSLMEKFDLHNLRISLMRLMQATETQSTEKLKLVKEILQFEKIYYTFLIGKKNIPVDVTRPPHSVMWEEIVRSSEARDIQKLGFRTTDINQEFRNVGLLGLENMLLYVRKTKDFFSKFIMEQNMKTDGRRCPFGLASMEVTRLLLDHFQISAEHEEKEPMLLAFEDIHSAALQGLFKMWNELEAYESDMVKMLNLVATQLEHVRRDREATLDQYKTRLANTSAKEVQKRQLEDLESGDDLLMKVAVRTLRDYIQKESFEQISRQRIGSTIKGSWFPVYNAKGKVKGQHRFYKLSQNKRYLFYGDFTEKPTLPPNYEQLASKIELSSVTDIVVGPNCPMVSQGKLKNDPNAQYAFALMSTDAENALADFVAENAIQYSEWTDGLRAALQKLERGNANPDTRKYAEDLTTVNLKMEMLNIRSEMVLIPDAPPPIPPPPENMNFFYKS